MRYALYVALGDSMGIDLYPSCDAHGADASPGPVEPIGAAALLYRNDDARWPEFRGRDLVRLHPGIEFRNLTADGAMIADVATDELARLGRDFDDPGILVTLTAGGNDLLDALFAGRLEPAVPRLLRAYADLVATIREELPRARLILTTVYDPTDGTGRLPGFEGYGRLPLEYLGRLNTAIRETARAVPGAALADVHRHFLGHGVSAPERERWYWPPNMIEPGARGASEIRRTWLGVLEDTSR